jgi:hypothetical protein
MKPKKFKDLYVQDFAVVGIYIDPDDGEFTANVFGTLFRNKVYEKLEYEIYQYAEETRHTTWVPVIIIEILTPLSYNDQTPFAGFVSKRAYLAATRGGNGNRVRESAWDGDGDGDRYEKSQVCQSWPYHWPAENLSKLPRVYSETNKKLAFLPYSEIAWRNLDDMATMLVNIRERLNAILLSEYGNQMLSRPGGLPLLEAWKDAPEAKI